MNQDLATDLVLHKIKESLASGQPSALSYTLVEDCLLYNNRMVIPKHSKLISMLLKQYHDSVIGGHSGEVKTYRRLAADFYWVGMKKAIANYVKVCGVCQRNKTLAISPAELLQPLQLPDKVWEDLSMDFIDGLPKSEGYDVIYIVVDCLSKYAHFIPLKHPYTTSVAERFITNIVKLHGMPYSIVSDRDRVFTNKFWEEIFRLQGIELCRSAAYHPQLDG